MTSETSAVYKSNPFELIKPAFAAFKLCWANIITLMLASIGAVVFLVLIYAIANFVGAGRVVNVLLFVLGLPVLLYLIMYFSWAIIRSSLSAVRGEKISFRTSLPSSWVDPLKLLVTELMTSLLILIGFVCLIIPGLFAMGFWAFAPAVTVDTGEWGWSALLKSRYITRGRLWDVLGAIFMPSTVGVIQLVPILGGLVYLVFTVLILPAVFVRYQSLLELKSQPGWESVPVSPWNYASLIIGLTLTGYFGAHSRHIIPNAGSPVEINQKAY